ncbi:MAG TPA: hypothetical protein VLT58_17645 [Polyangia bacterium]|nr:hypothetical protein [Polyangia bacterium]
MFVVALVLALVWMLAVINATTMGGFVHALLAGAVVLVLARIIQIRRAHQRVGARS